MKSKRLLAIAIVALFLFSIAPAVQAKMVKIFADVWTQKEPDREQLWVTVEAFDTKLDNPADFVASIKVTAPDETELFMTVDEHFSPYDGSFLALWDSSDFVSGDIPGGTYVIEVCANDGTVLKYQDKIDGSFLDISTIKSPSPGETGVGATPTIRWTKVSRARYYRIWLLDENWNSIYDYKRLLEVIGTSVKLPKGNLKPGKTYHMRIEARNDYQDIDKRSRTSWIVFTTANW